MFILQSPGWIALLEANSFFSIQINAWSFHYNKLLRGAFHKLQYYVVGCLLKVLVEVFKMAIKL